jgi:flagellar motor switch protein FliG
MEIKLKIGYEQLVDIIQQLPMDEVEKLKTEIERISRNMNSESEAMKDFESFIANGPVMSDEKFQAFEENRKHFTQWRAS